MLALTVTPIHVSMISIQSIPFQFGATNTFLCLNAERYTEAVIKLEKLNHWHSSEYDLLSFTERNKFLFTTLLASIFLNSNQPSSG